MVAVDSQVSVIALQGGVVRSQVELMPAQFARRGLRGVRRLRTCRAGDRVCSRGASLRAK